MTMTGHDDLTLSYVLNVPSGRPDTDELPLVIVLHGRGADANDLAGIAPEIDGPEGYRFVFPNAPRPFEIYAGMTSGFSWFDGLPPERSSVASSREQLLRLMTELLVRYPTPRGRIVLSGFSQGALMSLDCGFRTSEPLAGIVAMSGALFEDDLPDLQARKDQRVLIAHGLYDEVIPIIRARRARRVLEEHGVEAEFHEFPIGHQVSEEELAVVADFLRRCMAP